MRKIHKEELEIINKIFSSVTVSSNFTIPATGLSPATIKKAGWWVKLLKYDPQLQLETDENQIMLYPAIPMTTPPVIISEDHLGQVNHSLSNDEVAGDEELVYLWLEHEMPPVIAYMAIRWRSHFMQDPFFELTLNDEKTGFIAGNVYDRLSKIPRD